jgi:hypothetical protein
MLELVGAVPDELSRHHHEMRGKYEERKVIREKILALYSRSRCVGRSDYGLAVFLAR